MRLRALLDKRCLRLRLLGGGDELDRPLRGVMTTDLRDPGRYLAGGELVLSGLGWRHGPGDSEPFVRILAAAGVAGLAAGEAEQGPVPEDLVEACARHRLPLFAVPEDVSFATITEHVVRQVSTERAGDLAAVVERHRKLMSEGTGGGGPDAVLTLLDEALDLRAHVVSPVGRQIAGVAGPLPPETGAALAGEHLGALRTARPAPHRVRVRGRWFSLFPVGRGTSPGSGGDAPADPGAERPTGAGAGRALSDWFLAVEADSADWPGERLDLVRGVARLVAVERERRDASRAVRRRLAADVLDLLRANAAPSEIAAGLRAAGPVLLPGLGTAPRWQVVVASLEWAKEGEPASPEPDGPAAGRLLEEALTAIAGPVLPGEAGQDRVAVAGEGPEAVALVPLPSGADTPEAAGPGGAPQTVGRARDGGRPGGAGPAGGPRAAGDCAPRTGPAGPGGLTAAALLAAVGGPLGRGLSGRGRLTVGVSAVVRAADGLRGALEEARHARRVAAARTGPVCVAGHEELASHVLLLPFVPDDVRRAFTARLLEPLYDYDRRHRAGLVPTLRAFLDCDGSWTRCAAGLHLHVNTLRYRIGRIERLTGRDLSRLEDRLDFFLALRMT